MNSDLILSWYDKEARSFPWRTHAPHPYHIWLSEVMLQQTTTTTVEPYFNKFIQKWPAIDSLSQSSLDDVLHAWQGLGYYSRARNLHACAKEIMQNYDGSLPKEEKDLLKLPGIGPYTAAAIAAIAYDQPTAPVDGNIARIFSRLYKLEDPKETKSKLEPVVPKRRNGDFVQALMDIGATLCTPKNPKCEKCPLSSHCLAYKEGLQNEYPRKKATSAKPVKHGVFFWIENKRGQILIRKRPAKGLLASMMEIPSTPWLEKPFSLKEARKHMPVHTPSVLQKDIIEHSFTHFHLIMKMTSSKIQEDNLPGLWIHKDEFDRYAFPTLMQKAIKKLLDDQ